MNITTAFLDQHDLVAEGDGGAGPPPAGPLSSPARNKRFPWCLEITSKSITRHNMHALLLCNNITSMDGSSCANSGKGALNTPDI
eukprot:1186279-Prorocentrum_minimum.AAC.5